MLPFILALRLYAEISCKRAFFDMADRAMEEICRSPARLHQLLLSSHVQRTIWKILKAQSQMSKDRRISEILLQELRQEQNAFSYKIFDCICIGYEIKNSISVNLQIYKQLKKVIHENH